MKPQIPFLVFAALLTHACGNNKAEETKTSAETPAVRSASASETTGPGSAATAGDGIAGYWKLFLEAYDDNNNRKLDEEERKKGIKNRYTFRFNTDGTCQIQDTFKGRYEIKEEGGKKLLSVYRNRIPQEEEKDPPPEVYLITSVSNEELVLLETIGDHTFWIFRR